MKMRFEELYFSQFLHWKLAQLVRMADIRLLLYADIYKNHDIFSDSDTGIW